MDADLAETLKRRVDIDDFTAYMIVNLWGQNYDWPHNNWYAARKLPDQTPTTHCLISPKTGLI